MGQPGRGSSCRKSTCTGAWVPCAGHAGRGRSEGDPPLAAPASLHQPLGALALLLTFLRNKHLTDKPNFCVVVSFVCLFLLFLPELAVPRCSLVSGVLARCGCNAGAGTAPPAWAVWDVPLHPLHCPWPPLSRCFSLLQERLQGEAARGAAPGPGHQRSGTGGLMLGRAELQAGILPVGSS